MSLEKIAESIQANLIDAEYFQLVTCGDRNLLVLANERDEAIAYYTWQGPSNMFSTELGVWRGVFASMDVEAFNEAIASLRRGH